MNITNFVKPIFAWAFNGETADGYIEEIVATHIAGIKQPLVEEFKRIEFNKIYKKIRNPSKEEGIKKKVTARYDRGGYKRILPQVSREILSNKSTEDLGAYKRYADAEVGIGFVVGESQGVMKYCPLIPHYSDAAIKDLYHILEGVSYQGNGLESKIEAPALTKDDKKRFNQIKEEIKAQNKERDINYAVQLQIEANSVKEANELVEKYVSFIKNKAEVKLYLRPSSTEGGKFRAVYWLQITDPIDYNLQPDFSEQSNGGLMDICLNEIVKRKCSKKPGRDPHKVKEKFCKAYRVNYLFWKIRTPASILKSGERKKLMEALRMESLAWIYTNLVGNVMRDVSDSKKPVAYTIDGNPFSSIIVNSLEHKCRIRILPWYESLKENMPNEEFFESGKDYEDKMEWAIREEWTKKWGSYVNSRGYLGTQVMIVRYKNPRKEADAAVREKILMEKNQALSYSLLSSWFGQQMHSQARKK
ncbi:MAG: hypothetical protein K6T16_02280 [Candidatus Pacearchaeota archaeon]|nr:hypothetical protein [Candidatus Pacearchaeota archaeon]